MWDDGYDGSKCLECGMLGHRHYDSSHQNMIIFHLRTCVGSHSTVNGKNTDTLDVASTNNRYPVLV